LLFLYSLNL